VDEYQDRTPPAVNAFSPNRFENIDQHLTFDFTYSVGLMDDKLNLSATVVNILDNDPPRTAEFYNFDAYTHNPLGRTFKVSFTYTGGELF
jgi:outer membrane receptor protein involved in Fe transport